MPDRHHPDRRGVAAHHRGVRRSRPITGRSWPSRIPLPETLIGKDPVYYLEHTLKSWARPRDLSPFSAEALAHYRALLQDPARVHAVCEDYRAGATIDRQLDEADLAAGRKIACPTFVLWADSYLPGDPLDVWRPWCTTCRRAVGQGISWPRRTRRTRWPRSSVPRARGADLTATSRPARAAFRSPSSHRPHGRSSARGEGNRARSPMTPTGKALQVAQADPAGARGRRIALALGGGGARGLAHILMLEVFDELGLKPKVIAGTSIGALFGAAYASGLSARLIRAHTEEVLSQRLGLTRYLLSARSEPVQRFLNILPIRSSLLKPELLLDLMLPSKVARDFAHLAIPLKVVATDFYAQEQIVLDSGDLRSAIAASMALPALFTPVTRDGRVLMDGGLVNPLPFDVLKGEADITVAIDVSGASAGPGQPRAAHRVLRARFVLADPAALDRAREAEGPAARHLHRRRGRRVPRARVPPLQAGDDRGRPGQGAAQAPARARAGEPDRRDAAGRDARAPRTTRRARGGSPASSG